MVFIYLIRRGRRAFQARKAKRQAREDGTEDGSGTADVSPGKQDTIVDPAARAANAARKKALYKSRAKLMAALAIPVFLETLDYTGTYLSRLYILFQK